MSEGADFRSSRTLWISWIQGRPILWFQMRSGCRGGRGGTMSYPLSVLRCAKIVSTRSCKLICGGTLASVLSIPIGILKTRTGPDDMRRGHEDITEVEFWHFRSWKGRAKEKWGDFNGRSKFKFKRTATSYLILSVFEKAMIVSGLLGFLTLGIGFFIGIYIAYLRFTRGLTPGRPLISICYFTGFRRSSDPFVRIYWHPNCFASERNTLHAKRDYEKLSTLKQCSELQIWWSEKTWWSQ